MLSLTKFADRNLSRTHVLCICLIRLSIVLCGGVATAQQPSEHVVSHLIQHAVQADASQAWTFDPSVYTEDTRDLPIGVFDSGIGGLTVLEAILSLDAFHNETLAPGSDGKPDFAGERFIYLGDQANMPYGNYAAEGKEDFLRELILKDVIFLLGNRYWSSPDAKEPSRTKPPVKAIAIGCNTATAYGLEDIQSAFASWNIPVLIVGVVEAGARGVLELHQSGSVRDQSIAVLATVGTCNSGAYPRAISTWLGRAGRQVPTVIQQGFVELAAAIEGDPQITSTISISDIIRKDIRKLMDDYRQSGNKQPIGSVVLGCTHFPLVEQEILAAFAELKNTEANSDRLFESLIAESIHVVNPAELTAKELFRGIARSRLRARPTVEKSPRDSAHQFFISVPNPNCSVVQLGSDGGLTHEYKYGRSPQRLDIEDTLVVPMSVDRLPANSLNLIRTSLPHVWQALGETN